MKFWKCCFEDTQIDILGEGKKKKKKKKKNQKTKKKKKAKKMEKLVQGEKMHGLG
jgi:hypothetical protein